MTLATSGGWQVAEASCTLPVYIAVVAALIRQWCGSDQYQVYTATGPGPGGVLLLSSSDLDCNIIIVATMLQPPRPWMRLY